MRSAHKASGDQGPLKCEVCNKEFSTMFNLSRHKRIEHIDSDNVDDQVTIKCDFYSKEFSTSFSLPRHQIKIHIVPSNKEGIIVL